MSRFSLDRRTLLSLLHFSLLSALLMLAPTHCLAAGITVAPVVGDITPVTVDYLKKGLHSSGILTDMNIAVPATVDKKSILEDFDGGLPIVAKN